MNSLSFLITTVFLTNVFLFFSFYRYPYEYDYGHIVDAVNLWTKDMVWNVFMEGRKSLSATTSEQGGAEKKRNIIIFHCEFSSERGPAL